jgi:hypothetical protein
VSWSSGEERAMQETLDDGMESHEENHMKVEKACIEQYVP